MGRAQTVYGRSTRTCRNSKASGEEASSITGVGIGIYANCLANGGYSEVL